MEKMNIFNDTNDTLSFVFIDDVDDDTIFSQKLNVIQGCIYIPIFCAGIANNLLTILIILLNREMHTVTNCYLLNLAISDSLPLIVSLPFEIAFLPIAFPWGQFGCKLRSLLAETSTNASILTISAFTIERYLAVCRPLHTSYQSTTRRAMKVQVLIWLTAILSSTPYLYITKKIDNLCSFDENFPLFVKTCFHISATIFFVLPAFILCVLYALMARRLYTAGLLIDVRWSRSSGRESISPPTYLRAVSSENNGSERNFKKLYRSSTLPTTKKGPALRRTNTSTSIGQQQNTQSMKKSAFKMLFAVVIAFIICYAPFHAQRLITSSSQFDNLSLRQRRAVTLFYFISGIFYYLGSIINPIFYHLFSYKYREACLRTMTRIVHCQRLYSSQANGYCQNQCKSVTVARLVVHPSLPQQSLNVQNEAKVLETRYQPINQYKTNLEPNGNRPHISRLSLPTLDV